MLFCFFLFLDSCISGTAGSGKTELANDVSKIIGKSCYIFNCSAGMNYSLMEKIFKVFFHRKFDILSLSTVFRQLSFFFLFDRWISYWWSITSSWTQYYFSPDRRLFSTIGTNHISKELYHFSIYYREYSFFVEWFLIPNMCVRQIYLFLCATKSYKLYSYK